MTQIVTIDGVDLTQVETVDGGAIMPWLDMHYMLLEKTDEQELM